MAKNLWKRVVACLVALALVTGFFPSNTGGFWTGTGIVARADDGTVVTWNKYRLTEYVMAFQDETGAVGDPTTIDGITVEYYGGRANMLSGLYTYVNYEGVGQTAVKHLLFNSGDSTLKFSSAINNAFITKVVIEYDHVGSHGSLGDIDVNHNLWTDEDVTNSNGTHTLTLSGPAARTVTLRNHYLSYYYHLEDITSIQFYLTPSLYTTPDAYSNYSIKDLEDSGFTVVSGDTLYEVPGTPFMVKRNGRIIGFAHENSDGTYSYTIDDPREPITYEEIEGDSITVTNADDFRTALSEPRFNTILIGANIDFDSGFTISRNVTINLKARTITCDSSASDKTIRVTGGSPTIISTSGYWEDTVHGNVEGFDKIEATGGSLNIAAGRYDLPQGLSGSVRVTGGLFKVYDTFGINNLRGFVTGLNGAILRGEYAEVFPHTHAYYKTFTELDDGGISYLHRCDGCDHTVSSWSLTGEEVDTLIALNGGALTPTWTWKFYDPSTANLKLTISGETYNAAAAEPYNMNTAALRDLRDNGFVCSPESSDGQETVMTNYESNDFNGSNVAITGSSKLPNEKYEWGVPVGITNEPPMSLHALNGKTFYKVVFHVGAYVDTAASGARVDKGNITVLDGGNTLVATNINSDSLTLYSTEYFFQVSSVDVYYRSANSFSNVLTVNTEPNPDDCTGYDVSYTYRGQTYSKSFTGGTAHHSYGEPVWEWREDGNNNATPSAYAICTSCNHREDLAPGVFAPHRTEPTYTRDGAITFNAFVTVNGRTCYSSYSIPIPKLEAPEGVVSEVIDTSYDSSTSVFPGEHAKVYGDSFINGIRFDRGSVRIESDPHYLIYAVEISCVTESDSYEVTASAGEVHLPASLNDDPTVLIDNVNANNLVVYGGYRVGAGLEAASFTISYTVLPYVKVEATEPTATEHGNTEYYTGVDGKYYVLNGETYTEIAEDSWIIPATGVYEKVEAKEATPREDGNTEYYIGADGKYYKCENYNYIEIEEGSWIIPAIGFFETFETTNHQQLVYSGEYITVSCGMVNPGGFLLGVFDGTRATVKASGGKCIKKMVLTLGGYDAGNVACSSGVRSINGNTITFTDVNAIEATLYGSGNYAEISHIKVYYDDLWFDVYTKVEAKPATVSEPGNTEYYTCTNGKFYILDGDTYVEIEEGSWIIPALTVDTVYTNGYACDYSGNFVSIHGDDSDSNGIYVKNVSGTETHKLTVTAKSGYKLDTVVFHVGWNEDRSYCAKTDKGWLSVSDDGYDITVTNINDRSVTISTNLSDEDNWFDDEDPDAPQPETFFQINRVDATVIQLTGPVTYQKVEAVPATLYEPGNTEYYIGSNDKYYVKNGDTYTEIAEGSWIIPAKGVEAFTTNLRQKEYVGNRIKITCANVGDDDGFFLGTSSDRRAVITGLNGEVITKIELVRGYYDANSAQCSAGEKSVNGDVITFSNVNATEVTLSGSGSVQIKSVTVYFLPYTKVEAKTPTVSENGNIEYYVDSDGKIYIRSGDNFTETTLEAVTLPKVVLSHYAAVAPSCTANGNIEYWFDATNNRYYSDSEGNNEITQAATVVPVTGHTYGAPEWEWTEYVVNDHSDVAAWEAIADKISLGTSGIAAPSSDAGNTAWTGSYVYFGQYNGNVMKYRVLTPRTTAYGGATMLLDYDSTLCMYPWNTMSADFNGSAFLTKPGVFTDAERAAIASSTKAAGADYVSELGRGTYSGVGLNNEKIFVLEAAELTNPAYGYSNGNTRLKEVKYSLYGYWTRSPSNYAPTYGGFIYKYDGGFASPGGEVAYSEVLDISPAFNVNLNSVLFSTRVEGNTYKLTLKDGSLSIVPGSAARNGDIVTVPYAVSGSTANRVAVLITDKAYNADGATILYYAPLTGDYSANGSGTFTLPADLDSSCKVYVIAENANSDSLTNYASEPVEININETYTDSTGTYPIYRDGTLNVSEIRTGDIICAGVTINCDMQCPANGWNWFVYSDAHPYNPTDGGGLTGLATYDPLKTYVVPNNLKVLSIYNHEIKVQENAVIPEAPAAEGSSTAWKARAVFTCAHCNNAQTVTADVMSATIDASCASDGAVVYTARAALDGTEYTDVKTIQLPALGHRYGEPQWIWIEGNDTCTAVVHTVCAACGDIKAYNAIVTSATENGMILYSASATIDGEVYTSQHSVAVRHTVTIDADANCDVKVLIVGSGSDDGILVESGDTVEEGSVLSVTATPKNGYYLTVLPESTYTVTGDLTITVRSDVIGYNVTVNHEGGAAPTFTGTQSLESVGHGTRITLTAGEPDQDYEFIGWFQQNGVLLTASRNYSMTVVGATTVDARYRANSHTVTFMSCGQIKGTYVGTSITDGDFPAAPPANYGYEFTGWSMTASEINSMLELGNVTVEAQFAPIQLSFTVSIYNGESETPEEVVCTESTLISRTAEAVEGKQFAYWTLNGSIFSYNKKASYTAIESGVLKAVYASEAVEAVGTATLRTASYNIDTRKLTVNAYLTVPDGSRIVSAGLVASSSVNYDPASGDLTADNAQYNKSLASAVGKCVPVNYTWTKSSVNPGDVWYIRAHIQYYDSDNNLKDIYGTLITVNAGTDYDYAERSTVVIRTMTYNSDTKKASFNAYLTVPENSVIVKAGLVAVSGKNFDPSTTILTAENADYVKSLASAAGKCVPVNYTWTKSNVNPGDVWYARAYLVYTLNGVEHTVYGNLVTLTA